jgi:hypothetical protein
MYMQYEYIQGLCQPMLSSADHAPSFVTYATKTVQTPERSVHLTAAKFKPLIFSTLLLLVACIILLYNYKCTEC